MIRMPERTIPPLGQSSDTQRTCTRLVGHDGRGGEVLCGEPGVRHVIWWWRNVKPGENQDDCWDHGYVCLRHLPELTTRWTFAAAHELTAACGMPGSRCHFEENTCTFDGLDVVEPDRVLAVGVKVPA